MRHPNWKTAITTLLLGMSLLASCSQTASTPPASDEPAASVTAPPSESVADETATETVSSEAAAGEPEIFAENNIAIKGTDPVAYFTQGEAVPGSADYTYDWQGATWQFASAEHRDLFAANPEQYAPQYGGYCAWAVSQGYTAPIDPQAWKIVEGRLYLNYDKRVQQRWSRDIPGNIAKADQNWPAVLSQ
ncbi:YHS domain-containing (seleno)protein [Almyronema epifaneia]|uniref:YHS domain-containing (Seleno)protein n=1 Tax=Almyronema epifaneia S1 TaxID=2991925 RepID=A0ABW6IER1_9CYAN